MVAMAGTDVFSTAVRGGGVQAYNVASIDGLTFIVSRYDLKTHMHKVAKRRLLIMADPGTCQHLAIFNETCKNKYPWVFTLNTFIY